MIKYSKFDLDLFFEVGLDYKRRLIYLSDEIDYDTSCRIIKSLSVLDASAPEGNKPITILMSTPGGDYYYGMAIYDAIRACKNSITIIGLGPVMSMGAVILQSGDERVLMPHTRILLHYGMSSASGNSKDVVSWGKEYEKLQVLMKELFSSKILKKKPKTKMDEIDKLLSVDTLLSASEAVAWGLADKVMDI